MAVTVRRVTIALGTQEYAWARKRARREGRSVSAVLTAAAREAAESEAKRERQRKAWDAVSAWVLDGEPASADELEAARRALDGDE